MPWKYGSWGHHGAHLGPTGPRWAPCWPHEPCYLGAFQTTDHPNYYFILLNTRNPAVHVGNLTTNAVVNSIQIMKQLPMWRFSLVVYWNNRYQYLLWYMRIFKCSGLAFLIKWSTKKFQYIRLRFIRCWLSHSGGWMGQDDLLSISVGERQRSIVARDLPVY